MPDLDMLAPNYRRARQRWPNAVTLERGYEALVECFGGNGHGLVEHVKSYLESVCITILVEMGEPVPPSQPSSTELLVAALSPLGLRNSRGATKLDKVLSGFNRLTDAITEMRNETGALAHGKDGFLDPIAGDHARAFLHTGDAILAVLLNAFEGRQPDLVATREPYEAFPHLNERIDRVIGLVARIDEDGDRPTVVFLMATGRRDEAIELRVEPSRLLYGIDREAYVEVLETAELVIGVPDGEPREGDAGATDAIEMPIDDEGAPGVPVADVVETYSGTLDGVRGGVEAFLRAEGLDPSVVAADGGRLVDSVLATAAQSMAIDWKRREVMQAKLKIGCKRVLVQFGYAPEVAERLSEQLVGWFLIEGPEEAPVAVEHEDSIEVGTQ